MSTEVKSAIITGSCTLIAALIPIISLYIKNRKLTERLRYKAPGMAVAYYFSFVKTLLGYLTDCEDLYIKSNDLKLAINKKNTKLEVLLPSKLDKDVFKESNKEFNKYYYSGELYDGEKLLFRRLKYRKENEQAFIILDLPSILESAADYYKDSSRTSNFEISEKWEKITGKELEFFKDEILNMVNSTIDKDRVSVKVMNS